MRPRPISFPNLRLSSLVMLPMKNAKSLWMNMTDFSPLWRPFPGVEILKIRGSQGLSLGKIKHRHLRELYLESGGLGTDVLQQVITCRVTRARGTEHLLGSSSYGWMAL